jgi:predicted acyltransferase
MDTHFPWTVIGCNSIAAYVMDWTMKDWIEINLKKHLGRDLFAGLAGPLTAGAWGLLTLAIIGWVHFWMYRRRIFLRI